ncbi:sugar ABC transporter permease [Dehalococcoidia bacterium]|nr:sugar ABC transporter permease [Dehalococcoidia bacterium]
MCTTNITLRAGPSWLGKRRVRRGYGIILLLLSPALIIVLVFYLIPVILTVVMALTDLDWRFVWNFIGLGNFQRMMDDWLLPGILRVTMIYVFGTLATFNVTFALILALVLTSVGERTGTFFRSLWLFPRFTPPIVYGVIWMWVICPSRHGLLNSLLEAMGLPLIDWLFYHPVAIIIIVNGLIGASLGMLIFTAAIRSIPREFHWAAQVDGAGWLQDIRYVILPQIRWPLLFVTAFQTLSLLTSFEYILIVTRGGPFFASTVWSLYSYNLAFGGYFAPFQFGYGSAMALVLVAIGIGASLFYWRVFRFRSMITEPRIEVV